MIYQSTNGDELKSNILNPPKGFVPWLLFMFPLAVFSKFMQYTFLSPKYFYDSDKILRFMGSFPNFIFAPDPYNNAAVFSNTVNIFGFSTLYHWSVFYAIIFNIIFYNIAKKYRISSFCDLFFFFGTCVLLNLYVFNLSKEIFQVCIFLIVYLLLKSKQKLHSKVILSVIVLFFWGIIFRIYYCLIAIYIFMAYILLQRFFSPKRLFFMIMLLIIGFLVSLFFIRLISPKNYEIMLMMRSKTNFLREYSPDAETIILDFIENDGNPLIYLLNVGVSIIRMMLPAELVFISLKMKYLIFISYQFTLTFYYLNAAGNILRGNADSTQKASFCVFTGFLIGSGLFEPDFGSWIRHESAMLPVLLPMFFLPKENVDVAGNIGLK
jgi:hypothetical protein